MKEDFDREVARLATFLGVELPPSKLAALRQHVSMDAMAMEREVVTVRKGIVGDYKSHLTPQHWQAVDEVFTQRLGAVPAMAPLQRFMYE